MTAFDIWTQGDVLREVEVPQPLLASWDKSTHPSQVRLRTYLEDLVPRLLPLPSDDAPCFLHLDVNIHSPVNLLRHHVLENYLTPLFGSRWLPSQRFVLVSAFKRVGGSSRILLGRAELAQTMSTEWNQYSCSAGSAVTYSRWKGGIRRGLETQAKPLPAGAAEVHLAWRCSARRNRTGLWKPTGDAMGPVLGDAVPGRLFHPNDDRIVSLWMHRTTDNTLGHDVDVGMWWRGASDFGVKQESVVECDEEKLMRLRADIAEGMAGKGIPATQVFADLRSNYARFTEHGK